jgi:hypothetical protein
MKRLRLYALATTMVLVAVIALAGGSYLRGGIAHADAGRMAPGQVRLDAISHYHLAHGSLRLLKHASDLIVHGIPGIDSVPNFSGVYLANGFDPSGNPKKLWLYNTVGHLPELGGTTTIRVPIIPVSLDLLAADGSLLVHVDATHDVPATLNSPLFQKTTYSSSRTPTQFTDAVQRAEYASKARSDWHTLLKPVVESGVTLEMPWGSFGYAVWSSGPQAGQIAFVLLDAGIFDKLMYPSTFAWPPDTSSVMGALEASGEITTHDITTFLLPDTFQEYTSPCCFIFAGEHDWDTEPGDASNGNLQRYFLQIDTSWFSNDLAVSNVTGIQDVSALSHELTETLNDPFVGHDGVHDITPWWDSNGQCQDLLETGDPVEVLPNADYPITMNGMIRIRAGSLENSPSRVR